MSMTNSIISLLFVSLIINSSIHAGSFSAHATHKNKVITAMIVPATLTVFASITSGPLAYFGVLACLHASQCPHDSLRYQSKLFLGTSMLSGAALCFSEQTAGRLLATGFCAGSFLISRHYEQLAHPYRTYF